MRLTRKIQAQIDEEKMNIFENTIVPFDKTNSQYIEGDSAKIWKSQIFAEIKFFGEKVDFGENFFNISSSGMYYFPM